MNNTGTFIYITEKKQTFLFYKIFNDNLHNLKNTWKGIKNLSYFKTVSHSSPFSISDNIKTTTSPSEITNAFSNYF